MEGGFFLIQRGHVARPEASYDFIQIIGYDRFPDAEPGEEITGRLYTSGGDTLTYICEAGERTLTIWFGEKGSPSFYKGEFSEDGDTNRRRLALARGRLRGNDDPAEAWGT